MPDDAKTNRLAELRKNHSITQYEPADVAPEFLDGFRQIPGETALSFTAYRKWRDLGPGRTIIEVAKSLEASQNHLYQISRQWHWQVRLIAYERFAVEAEQNALIEQARTKAAEVMDRRAALIEREWDTSEKLFKKAGAMLNWPLARQEVSADGKTTVYIPAKWSQFTASQLLELASQLGRRSLEMPTSYQQVDAHLTAQGSLDMTTAHMTPDEKERYDAAQALAASVFAAVMSGKEPESLIIEGSAIEKQPAPEPPAWYTPNKGPLIEADPFAPEQ